MNKQRKSLNQRKQSMMTDHHILNKCRQDLFNVFQQKNKIRMNRLVHDNRHNFHWNEHPQETLQNISRMKQVMSARARELYDELCSMNIEEFYDNQFLREKLFTHLPTQTIKQ